MTIIPDRFDKIGIVLREIKSNLGIATTFTTSEVYALYVQRYPGDVQMMEDRKLVKPTAHNLEGYLNGEIYLYSQQTDGSDPDRPAINFLEKRTYCFISNLIRGNKFSKECAQTLQQSSNNYLPNKDDFESAYRMICLSGDRIHIDSVLDRIENNVINSGHNPQEKWRLITRKNIEKWVKEK